MPLEILLLTRMTKYPEILQSKHTFPGVKKAGNAIASQGSIVEHVNPMVGEEAQHYNLYDSRIAETSRFLIYLSGIESVY